MRFVKSVGVLFQSFKYLNVYKLYDYRTDAVKQFVDIPPF